MTDDFWGRMAWLQCFLVDYRSKNKNDRKFWDAVDEELTSRREKALEYSEDERAGKSSVLFEEALKAHVATFPLKRGGKLKAGKEIPDWQRTISWAVAEMDKYTLEQLAGESEGDDQQDDDAFDAPSVDPSLDS
ncbi:hypothetical protein B0H10DRAFT_2009376 [Mycena sp. CBHHK59/15]|nr:hypothetical protein B0H10DRAFT_2009376 [Mycena sp. CBHHK59/15]